MDPHHLLPEESFLDLFQASDPSEIANASSVSHDWRSSIQKASTLHRVIDLTMREDQTAKFLLNHLERFSKLSLAKLEVVKIEFSPFWNELKEWDPRFPDYSACSELFNLLTLSRKTLKVLKLIMRSNDRLSLLDNHSNLDKLISFLSDKDAFPSLEHIELEIPSPIKATSSSASHYFSIGGSKISFRTKRSPRVAIPWIREITGHTGKGLGGFGIETGHFKVSGVEGGQDIAGDFMDLLEEVEKSKDTLRELEVGDAHSWDLPAELISQQLLTLVLECPVLTSVKVALYELDGFEVSDFNVTKSQIKHLSLVLGMAPMVFNEGLIRWLGSSLESFSFKHKDLIPSDSFFSILLSNTSLKNLEFSSFEFSESDKEVESLLQHQDFNPLSKTFEFLERLSLQKVPPSLIIFLRKMTLPKLSHLEIKMGEGEIHVLDLIRCHPFIKSLTLCMDVYSEVAHASGNVPSLASVWPTESKAKENYFYLPIRLPNLEQLSLNKVTFQMSHLMLKGCSKLTSISINQCSGISKDTLLAAIGSSLSTLEKLQLTAFSLNDVENQEDGKELLLEFCSLKSLGFKDCSFSTVKFFSNFDYPVLRKLEVRDLELYSRFGHFDYVLSEKVHFEAR